jgi:hypothetical protein
MDQDQISLISQTLFREIFTMCIEIPIQQEIVCTFFKHKHIFLGYINGTLRYFELKYNKWKNLLVVCIGNDTLEISNEDVEYNEHFVDAMTKEE